MRQFSLSMTSPEYTSVTSSHRSSISWCPCISRICKEFLGHSCKITREFGTPSFVSSYCVWIRNDSTHTYRRVFFIYDFCFLVVMSQLQSFQTCHVRCGLWLFHSFVPVRSYIKGLTSQGLISIFFQVYLRPAKGILIGF